MIDAARAVLAVANGDHSTKPRIALVRGLEPGRWPHIAFVEGYPLAFGQTLTAIRRVPEDAMRVIMDENTIMGAHGCAHIHPTDAVGAEGDPVAAARQHFTPEAWTFEATAFYHKGPRGVEITWPSSRSMLRSHRCSTGNALINARSNNGILWAAARVVALVMFVSIMPLRALP